MKILKILIVLVLYLIIGSYSNEILINSSIIKIEIDKIECKHGHVYIKYLIKNKSNKDLTIIKTYLEYPEHTIKDIYNKSPLAYKAIYISADDSDIIYLKAQESIFLIVEAKFLNYYSLSANSNYVIELSYLNPNISKKQIKKGVIDEVYIGKIEMSFCE